MATSTDKPKARITADAAIGMAWWNAMHPRQHAEALRAADTACPAEAWAQWKETTVGFKCEENAHG